MLHYFTARIEYSTSSKRETILRLTFTQQPYLMADVQNAGTGLNNRSDAISLGIAPPVAEKCVVISWKLPSGSSLSPNELRGITEEVGGVLETAVMQGVKLGPLLRNV